MNTTPERYAAIKEIFLQARAKPAAPREAFLEEACAGDADLRREVEGLLEEDSAASQSATDLLPGGEPPTDSSEQPGEIGGYRIHGVLGEGGMGIVYQAEQQHPRREVALKVIRPGFASNQLLRRLEREAEFLGQLQHPGIAQVFEASAADTGEGVRPFFAMELVRGRPITVYARERTLGTRARLRLLLSVCEAVEHAHQKGIIHRDLKPGNILVDAAGQPKILDFGIARATDADIQATTMQTNMGQLIGTVPYMSPEQVSGDPVEVDTRSDVYSLGVVCYELLSGRLPHDLSRKTIPEAVRIIGEEEPMSLSSVDSAFRGDVDAIVRAALEKDKARRYASASALAADIRRYLRGEPILARLPSATYQLRKLVVRHKAPFILASLLFLSVLTLAVVSTVQALRIADERNEARRQADIAEAVLDFLNDDMLGSIDPQRARGREVTVAETLAAAASKIEGAFTDTPLVEAAVRTTIGLMYLRLGKYRDAEPHLQSAMAIRQEVLGAEHVDTAASQRNLAELLLAKGETASAAGLYREALDTHRELLGREDPETLLTMGGLAVALRRNLETAAAGELLGELLALQREVLGEQHELVADTLNSLGTLRYTAEEYEQAEAYYREALVLREEAFGDSHLMTAQSQSNLAVALRQQGRYEEAQELYRRALAVRSEILGDRHDATANTRAGLAGLYILSGDYAAAKPLCRQVIAILEETLGEGNPRLATARTMYARCLIQLEDFEHAESLLLSSYPLLREKFGDRHFKTRGALANLVDLYDSWGKPDQAAEWRAKLEEPEATAQPTPP